MNLSRAVYSGDLKIAAMRTLDAGSGVGEIAGKYQLSPNLLARWRGEWRTKRRISHVPAWGGGEPIYRRSTTSQYHASLQGFVDSVMKLKNEGGHPAL